MQLRECAIRVPPLHTAAVSSTLQQPLPPASPAEAQQLEDRTRYESWLLDAVYEISEEPNHAPSPSELIYQSLGASAEKRIYGAGRIVIGDWRPGFLQVGAPVVFGTSFKLLDMLMEWVLERNSRKVDFRFTDKLKALQKGVSFPLAIGSRPWLRERLIGLYSTLEPLRGTIVHEHHFTSNDGALAVSSSRNGVLGPVVTCTAQHIRALAKVCTTAVHLASDPSGRIEVLQEKRLRYLLDEIVHMHGHASLGQRRPEPMIVKMRLEPDEPFEIELASIEADAARFDPTAEAIFAHLELFEGGAAGTVHQ